MGKLTQGLLGAVHGKVGPVIGATWKGIPYIKAKPGKRGVNRKPGEKRNQEKFAVTHRWLRPVIDFLREGFKGYSATVEGFNAAKSYTLKHAFKSEGEQYILDPSLVKVSTGSLPLPTGISVVRTTGRTLRFGWDTHVPDDANHNDQVMLLAYNDKTSQGEPPSMKLNGEFRYKGSDELELPGVAGNYHVYLAFTAHDRSRQSDSIYLGEVAV